MSIKQLTDDMIADTAYRLLCRKTINKLTMTELAAECQISKPALYHHFCDKFAVARYLCERFSNEFYLNNSYASILSSKHPEQSFYVFRYADFFRNVLCYTGQNNLFDCLAEIELAECLKEIYAIEGTQEISDDLRASAEYYAYSVWHAMYAMLTGKITQRYLTASRPAMCIYWPPLLVEVFSRANLAESAASDAQKA